MDFIELRNFRVKGILEAFRYTYTEKWDITKTNSFIQDGNAEGITFSRLDQIISEGQGHVGGPLDARSYGIKPSLYKGVAVQEYYEDWSKLHSAMCLELGISHSALSQLYPPNGFIGWHNNANASGYNLLFTWSETGEGSFEYLNPKTDKIVVLKDRKGWSCKAGYFGNYGEPGKVIYHCARTKCWRMTLSYTFGRAERPYWLDAIDHIENE